MDSFPSEALVGVEPQVVMKINLSASKQLFLGLILGTLLGVFFGELVGFLDVAARGYIQLLQMTVLPYVTVSLISGLGSLTYQEAKMLFSKVGALLLVIWSIAFAILLAMPYAFPSWESASFFSTTLLETREDFDFLGLYIPANPFYAMANNLVPAVVLFSAATGLALIGVEKKQSLLENLATLNKALTEITRFVVRLAPLGIFAIAASAAGTMSIEQLGRLQVFFITYILITILVTFWILPGLVSALTPIGHGEILGLTKDALVTAFMTGNLFIVLPILTDVSKELLRRHQLTAEESATLPEVIVPLSFNFPHTGKVLTLSFVLFAAWFSEVVIPFTQYPRFAVTGLVSFFGSVNIAVPFLLDLLQIPADMFELFLATGIVNARFGTLIAAMHTMTLALLGTAAVLGTLKISARKLLRYAVLSVVLTALTIGGARTLFEHTMENEYRKDQVLRNMQLLRDRRPATVYTEPADPLRSPLPGLSRLEQIEARGFIRVGYSGISLPYAYSNNAGDLVGFDVEMAHQLAQEMGVGLEFVPVDVFRLEEELSGPYCDVIMSGLVITTERARDLVFSAPYIDETMAILVRDHRRAEFASVDKIRETPGIKLAVPNIPYLLSIVQKMFPQAEITPIYKPEEFLEAGVELDGFVNAAERSSAWSLLYPQYSVVVPQPDPKSFPLAYPVAEGDQKLAQFLSTWIDLKKKDGTIQTLYDYWILGKNAEPRKPRWSVVRNVLGWVE